MAKSDKGTILYVGGLNESVKKEEIEKEFERFGKLIRVWVAFNPPGFAFVEYENKDDAEKAVNAMHSAMVFGSRLRVEISRGRGGGRGGSRDGFSSRGRGGFRGGRDFGGRGSDFGGRGRGGRGGFNRGSPYDRNEPMKPFRGGGMGGRFDDFADRRRDFGPIRDFDDRGFGASRDFRSDDLPRGFGAGRDDFPSRDYGHGGRDFPPSRDLPDRDFSRRDFGSERPVNGAARSYGNLDPLDRGFNGRDLGGGRDFGGAGQASLGARGFGSTPAPRRESGGFADYGADRDIGMRREAVRDFNPPRDLGNARDFGARPSRVDDYTDDRYGAAGRGGFGEPRAAGGPGAGFASARYAGADIDGSADYGGFGARDRFRSRSPIGRVSRPLY